MTKLRQNPHTTKKVTVSRDFLAFFILWVLFMKKNAKKSRDTGTLMLNRQNTNCYIKDPEMRLTRTAISEL